MTDEPKPTASVEKTSTETVKLAGEAATNPPQPSLPVADDFARKSLALAVIVQFVLVVGFILWASRMGQKIEYGQLVIGAEIAFMTTVLNYYYGSSSGSTAKNAATGNK